MTPVVIAARICGHHGRQRVAHRGFEHGARVDRDHLDPGPPLASLGADPRRHTRRGAALDLPQQPGTADQVNQPGMPPVGDDFPDLTAVGRLDQAELRLPASGLVDPQVRHRRRVLRQRSLGRGLDERCALRAVGAPRFHLVRFRLSERGCAPSATRTRGLPLRRRSLYPLSYRGSRHAKLTWDGACPPPSARRLTRRADGPAPRDRPRRAGGHESGTVNHAPFCVSSGVRAIPAVFDVERGSNRGKGFARTVAGSRVRLATLH